MQRILSVSLAILVCCSLLIATERQALAYVDPGSGLLVLQSAASAVAAIGYFMRRRIRALFGGRPETTPPATDKGDTRKAA